MYKHIHVCIVYSSVIYVSFSSSFPCSTYSFFSSFFLPQFSSVLPAMMVAPKKRHNSAPHAGEPPELIEADFSVLPASLSFQVANEVQLLKMLISDENGAGLQFKLAPAYALYMIARQHLSPDFLSESDRQASLVHMLKSTCSLVRKAVKVGTRTWHWYRCDDFRHASASDKFVFHFGRKAWLLVRVECHNWND